jgi:lysophospholipase L1-like esterase
MMRVIAVGDSIAAGIGDVSINGRVTAWSGRLAAASRGSHVNLAVPGARIGMVQTIQVPAALLASPDVVLMSVGGNDVIDRRFEPRRFAEGLNRSLDMMQATGCRTVLLTVADWSTSWPMPGRLRQGFRRRIDRVNEVIRNAASAIDAHVIERAVQDPLQDRDFLHPDRVHLSPRGYHRLAQITADLLGLPPVGPPEALQTTTPKQRLRPCHIRPLLKRTPDLARLLLTDVNECGQPR